MPKIYANCIKAGTWTIEQVPAIWRKAVEALIAEAGE